MPVDALAPSARRSHDQGVPPNRSTAAGVWAWVAPLRALRQKRRRFASAAFLAAGIAFGTLLYLVISHPERTFANAHLPVFLCLVALMAALFWLGANAEVEVSKLEREIAALEEEAVRRLGERG